MQYRPNRIASQFLQCNAGGALATIGAGGGGNSAGGCFGFSLAGCFSGEFIWAQAIGASTEEVFSVISLRQPWTRNSGNRRTLARVRRSSPGTRAEALDLRNAHSVASRQARLDLERDLRYDWHVWVWARLQAATGRNGVQTFRFANQRRSRSDRQLGIANPWIPHLFFGDLYSARLASRFSCMANAREQSCRWFAASA
jgi:hypothetical protein